MNKRTKKECESSCDVILPDYMGDIKKVLYSKARALPTGKFADGDSLVLSGVVEYDVLYADFENKLTSLVASSDYEMKLGIDAEAFEDSQEEIVASQPMVRVTGPRKLTVKCVVQCHATVSEDPNTATYGDAFEGGREPVTYEERVEYESSLFGVSEEIKYSDEVERLGDVTTEGIEVITSGGSVRILEARAVDGGVEVKGEIMMQVILRTDDQPPFVIKKTRPFNEIVKIDGASADMQAAAEGILRSVETNISGTGEECVAILSAAVEYRAEVSENRVSTVIADAYLRESKTENAYEVATYQRGLGIYDREIPITFKMQRSEVGCENVRSILFVGAELRSVAAEPKENGVEFSGDGGIYGAACEINDDNCAYLSVKFQSPFSVFCDLGVRIPDDAILEYSLTGGECDGTLDGENLYVRCMARARIRLSSEQRVKRLVSASVTGTIDEEKDGSVITVYYPKADESLFEVAKKFRTTPDKVARDNSLVDEAVSLKGRRSSLDGVKQLVIM